jgi:hypothetical protein
MNFSLPIFNFHTNRTDRAQESSSRPRPTSQAVIDGLERTNVTDGRQCSICFEPMAENCVNLPCEHAFHEHCITRWLHRHSTCPMCRTSVTEEEDYEDSTADDSTGINFVHRIQLQTILTPPSQRHIHFIFMFLNGFQVDTCWDSSTKAYELLEFTRRFSHDNGTKILYNIGQSQFNFSTSDAFSTLTATLHDIMVPNHCIMRVLVN